MKLRKKLLSVVGAVEPLALCAFGDSDFGPGFVVFLFKKLNRPNREGGLAAVATVLGVAASVGSSSVVVLLFRCTTVIPAVCGVWSVFY